MYRNQDPKWLGKLSRQLKWLAVPNIAIIFITLQVLGFLFVLSDAAWFERLALIPGRVLQGEVWRLITFLALPLSLSPLWMIFALWFMYFILNLIESEWGDFKTTFYVLVSLVLTVVFSFIFDYPVTEVSDFTSTLFLAAAALYPDFEIRLYLVLPVKMKYLGWLALAFVGLRLVHGSWIDRLFLVTIYSNYLVFFGPTMLSRLKDWNRRRNYRSKLR
ncbi:MAG: rhomboid family intramembrane serine protease [Deltaproteobacteria bacterium]|nr:rhomboid family intramembrane serine protease [Deltaproteobacteria bacterium]